MFQQSMRSLLFCASLHRQINIQNISHFLSIHFSISTINVCVYWMCRHLVFFLYSPLVTNQNYRLSQKENKNFLLILLHFFARWFLLRNFDGVFLLLRWNKWNIKNYVIEKKNEKKMRTAEYERNKKKSYHQLCVNICAIVLIWFDLIWKLVCCVQSACVTEIN